MHYIITCCADSKNWVPGINHGSNIHSSACLVIRDDYLTSEVNYCEKANLPAQHNRWILNFAEPQDCKFPNPNDRPYLIWLSPLFFLSPAPSFSPKAFWSLASPPFARHEPLDFGDAPLWMPPETPLLGNHGARPIFGKRMGSLRGGGRGGGRQPPVLECAHAPVPDLERIQSHIRFLPKAQLGARESAGRWPRFWPAKVNYRKVLFYAPWVNR